MTSDRRTKTSQILVHSFSPQTKNWRWFVAVTTGVGPISHVGDFATEAEAQDWILTKSKHWPGKPI